MDERVTCILKKVKGRGVRCITAPLTIWDPCGLRQTRSDFLVQRFMRCAQTLE